MINSVDFNLLVEMAKFNSKIRNFRDVSSDDCVRIARLIRSDADYAAVAKEHFFGGVGQAIACLQIVSKLDDEDFINRLYA